MKRIAFLILILLIFSHTLFADIQQSVVKLLSSLSRQYEQQTEGVYFKKPIAVIPFIEEGELAREHNLGMVTEELIRKEIVNSTYFILTERQNLESLLQEIEFSLSDLASEKTAVRVGNMTGAAMFIAGSVAESGNNFLLNARLIDVETAVVMGAESITLPKDEFIEVARTVQYSYVSEYGLGFFAALGGEILLSGMPSQEHIKENLMMLNLGSGVSYRPWDFLQVCAAFHNTWGSYPLGEFDPSEDDYDNSELVAEYYDSTLDSATKHGLPQYTYDYTQNYLEGLVFLVWNPIKELTLSVGGGGLLGLWVMQISIHNLPIYIGSYDEYEDPIAIDDEASWTRKSFFIATGNGGLTGVIGAAKIEYYISPRVLFFLQAQYKKVFASTCYDYTFADTVENDEGFRELSDWIPSKTPFGDPLQSDIDSIVTHIGMAISF